MPEKITVYDYAGTARNFSVQPRLYPNGILLEAAEDIEYGYRFAVHGELDCNQTELFQKLADKVEHRVSIRYTKTGKFPNGQKYHSIIANEAVGHIDHEEMSPSVPKVVIDGQPYTWEQFGEMVKSFEGFQFQMKLFRYDRGCEVKRVCREEAFD